jgi:hypothetical protein
MPSRGSVERLQSLTKPLTEDQMSSRLLRGYNPGHHNKKILSSSSTLKIQLISSGCLWMSSWMTLLPRNSNRWWSQKEDYNQTLMPSFGSSNWIIIWRSWIHQRMQLMLLIRYAPYASSYWTKSVALHHLTCSLQNDWLALKSISWVNFDKFFYLFLL